MLFADLSPQLARCPRHVLPTHPHSLTRPPAPIALQVKRAVGEHLLIEDEGCLFPCEVLEVIDASKGIWLVHYLGWDEIRDENVGGKGANVARILPDTPENQELCVDLKTQIRRVQRKGNQLPRGDTKLILRNKVFAATVIETAIRQQERGLPVTTMHYITFEADPSKDGWFDQALLRLAPPSAAPGSTASAEAGKKQRGKSAKAYMLVERKDALLRRMGSEVAGAIDPQPAAAAAKGTAKGGGRAKRGGAAAASRSRGASAATAAAAAASEDAQMRTWVWSWSGARSPQLTRTWVETATCRGPAAAAAVAAAETTAREFTLGELSSHASELKNFNTKKNNHVFLKRNSVKALQGALEKTTAEGKRLKSVGKDARLAAAAAKKEQSEENVRENFEAHFAASFGLLF